MEGALVVVHSTLTFAKFRKFIPKIWCLMYQLFLYLTKSTLDFLFLTCPTPKKTNPSWKVPKDSSLNLVYIYNCIYIYIFMDRYIPKLVKPVPKPPNPSTMPLLPARGVCRSSESEGPATGETRDPEHQELLGRVVGEEFCFGIIYRSLISKCGSIFIRGILQFSFRYNFFDIFDDAFFFCGKSFQAATCTWQGFKDCLLKCKKRMDVYGCFQKWWYPQIIHFNRDFHYKPSILGYPYVWKHPYSVDELQSDVIFNRPMIATGSRDCHRPALWGRPRKWVKNTNLWRPKTGGRLLVANIKKQDFFSGKRRNVVWKSM